MGNYCSTGINKKNLDNDSEKSEESPSYQLNDKNKKHKNSKGAPLADPEPISDLSVNAQNTSTQIAVSPNNGFVTIPSTNDTTSKAQQQHQQVEAGAGDTVLPISASCNLPTVTINLPTNLHPLYGKLISNRRIEKDKKIVLYILAADNDHDTDTGELQKIHERLQKKCDSKGFELLISNLHDTVESSKASIFDESLWQDGPLEAQGGHALAANCLAEISRQSNHSYLIPILFLGMNLGKPLLPLTIESQDFITALTAAEQGNGHGKLLLEKWYILDNKAQPACYRLKTLSKEDTHEIWSKEFNDLLTILVNIFSKELRDSYLTTVVEQEINNTVLISQELSKRCIWVQNLTTGQKEIQLPLEIETLRRFTNISNDLKTQLLDKHIIKHTANDRSDQYLLILETLISAEIDAIVEEHWNKCQIPACTYGVDRRLFQELEEVNRHSKILSQNCADVVIMEHLKKYICESSNKPLVIYGKSGTGKSVLCAKLAQQIHVWVPECCFILRYANLTEWSTDITSILQSISLQMSMIAKGKPYASPHILHDYSEYIEDCLKTTKYPIVIVIDSMNRVTDLDNLDWLPINLPENVKIILTITTDVTNIDSCKDVATKHEWILFKLREKIVKKENFIFSSSFTHEQWQEIINVGGSDFYAANGALQLPDDWKHATDKTPIQAKILWWLAWLGVKELKDTSVNNISNYIFQILEKKYNKNVVAYIISLIVASRQGIPESEIIHLIENCTITGSAIQLWLNFCWFMGPFLLHSSSVSIMDELIKTVAEQRYREEIKKAHKLLHDYYTSRESAFVNSSGKDKCLNIRKYINLPYHAYQIDKTSFESSMYLTDLNWLFGKIKSTGCTYVFNDINLLKSSADHILLLRKCLQNHFVALNYDAQQFYPLLWDTLKESSWSGAIIEKWRQQISSISVTRLEMLKINDEDNTNLTDIKYDSIVNLNGEGYFVISISTEQEQISVWDVARCCPVRTLKGIPQPSAICPVGDYGAAVLCQREIKVIDLDECCFKVTLKGVMNQKMPYFGLHDSKHLVCLSRNRMYVNLMNLESGDCVTTFKAGEDRFLNSLLVSGDGRILVCGDETQKPFPLLVWHLSQRKLLYDLRIPHHDFITSLAAITHEGSYVCVVAKELAEPTPNFIVVYDLQSGTLFKKWKPSCNTVSLAISQTVACVIAGLEDARILVWDLVTGNCKITLLGHNAPVTLLKLDPTGKILLSGDKEGRDLSVRLWNLDTGESLAVYTPSHQITTCEILADGKYVVLALENKQNLVTLELKNVNSEPSPISNAIYGKSENEGKIIDLQNQ